MTYDGAECIHLQQASLPFEYAVVVEEAAELGGSGRKWSREKFAYLLLAKMLIFQRRQRIS